MDLPVASHHKAYRLAGISKCGYSALGGAAPIGSMGLETGAAGWFTPCVIGEGFYSIRKHSGNLGFWQKNLLSDLGNQKQHTKKQHQQSFIKSTTVTRLEAFKSGSFSGA